MRSALGQASPLLFNVLFRILGAGVGTSALALHHLAGLLSGTWENIQKLRYEVKTYCSDQGDEEELAQTPLLFEHGCTAVNDARTLLRAKQMADHKIAAGFFFPLMMPFADLLHITFNGFEESVKAYTNWKQIQTFLTSIVFSGVTEVCGVAVWSLFWSMSC